MSTLESVNWMPVFIVIWAVLFGSALINRLLKLKEKPGGLMKPAKSDFLFDERYASARSHKSTFTHLGGGMRCMHVSTTLDAVMIRPHFPFSLVGADSDLVLEIPIKKITDFRIDPHAHTFGVTLVFERDKGEGKVDLDLKQPADFIATIAELKKGPNHTTVPLSPSRGGSS
jgi:hypothetical protein